MKEVNMWRQKKKKTEEKDSSMVDSTHASLSALWNDNAVSKKKRTKNGNERTQTNATHQQTPEIYQMANASQSVKTNVRLICPGIKSREAAEESQAAIYPFRQSAFNACMSQMIIYSLLSTTNVWINSCKRFLDCARRKNQLARLPCIYLSHLFAGVNQVRRSHPPLI